MVAMNELTQTTKFMYTVVVVAILWNNNITACQSTGC